MSDKDKQSPAGLIKPTLLTEALGERYLAYAMSTIVSRSLPDVRDGLKPVHRRLLFAMRELKLDPAGGFKKCARVVGDVIGKYHPHGDVAVYDAMVRLAQDFAVRYPLVEGQGNFGNIDGDNAAAMRYTEAKLTEVAAVMLAGLDDNSVDFRPNYDGSEDEPVVLASAFPNLLANGASGIAVGMASSIPPHNAGEVIAALLHLIKIPTCADESLLDHMQGPDFPTGGMMLESKESLLETYRTGRGSFRLRAQWELDKLAHGQYQIIITQIPYQVQKSRLIEKVAELLSEKKLPLLSDIRDESAEDVRIILEPRNRATDPEQLMEQLFRQTDLEVRVQLNMNVLDKNAIPKVMSLREVLQAFLDHRKEVLERSSQYRLGKIETRLEVLGGFLIAYLNLDEVIRIIRFEDDPKAEMIKAFALTENQVESILNMRLRALRKLEEFEIRKEHDALIKERDGLLAMLGDDSKKWKVIAKQLAELAKKFGSETVLGRRRTQVGVYKEIPILPTSYLIEKKPVTVILSQKGWVWTVKGHSLEMADIKFKDGDGAAYSLKCETSDRISLFASDGRFFTLNVDKLPQGLTHAEPVRLMIDLANDSTIINMFVTGAGARFLIGSDIGHGFIIAEEDLVAQTKNGRVILNLGEGEKAFLCMKIEPDHDCVAIIGENRKLLIFKLDEVPTMSRGRGVILQKYKNSKISDVQLMTFAQGINWRAGDVAKTEPQVKSWLDKRGSVGRLPPLGFPRNNKFFS